MTTKLPAPFDGSSFLSGQVALVTGGSSGIGEQIATVLAAAGATVAVVASGSLDKAVLVADAINASGGKAKGFAADVRDDKAVAALVADVEKQLGPIDILVNSAGVYYATPAGGTPKADLDKMVDVNFKGTWNVINAVAPGLKARKRGKIVNMASCAGLIGLGGYAIYCGTKAGIIMMTKALARELAPFDINVNGIAPGNTATPMNADVRTPENKAIYEFMERITPSNTPFTDPSDIAAMALYLVSPAARPIHGAIMSVDEGITTGI